jgi:hypothetical protein
VFWIFANDEYAALAADDAALGTALANGRRNFHEKFSLLGAVSMTAKVLIILVVYQFVHTFSVICGFTGQSG